MSRLAFAAGRWRPFASVRVPLDDRAVLYGDTVFETLRVEQSVPLFWREHRRRLVRSLAIAAFVDRARVLSEIDHAVRALPSRAHAVLRLTISRGVGSGFKRATEPIVYGSLTETTEQAPPGTLRLALVDAPRTAKSGLFGAKHGNYAFAAAAVQRFARGADDVLFCDGKRRVYETTVGNVFIVSRGVVMTPPADGSILRGTTRDVILRGAKRLGLETRERAFDVGSLLRCDEAFVTSSIVGLTRVSHVGRTALRGDGTLTGDLFGVYREAVNRELR